MNDEVGMRNAQCTMHNAEPGNGEPRRMDLEIGELGIRFTPLRSQDYWLVAAYWGDGRNRHVYSVRMEREGYGWRAVLENDGREVGSFSSTLSQYTAAHMALAALKAYIRRGHRRTLRTLRKAEEAAIEMRPNCRGFLCGTFRDNKGEECSLQESSNVKPCVWLGIDEPQPVVMSADVAGLASPRLEPIDGSTETTGWHRYVLPDGVRVFGRMELDREMAGRLAAALAHFAKNGALPRKGGAE